jgi:hypothetical protein
LLVERQEVDVLAFVQHGKHIREDWASWVPDWASNQASGNTFAHTKVSGHTPATIKVPECALCKIERYDTISVSGFMADTVESLAEDYFDKKCLTRAYKLRQPPGKKEWLDSIAAFIHTYQHTFNEENLANSMIAGRELDTEPTFEDGLDFMAEYHAFVKYVQEAPESQTEYSETTNNFFNLVMNTVVRRRFFVTKQGMLGLGPAAMNEGDVVGIVFGSSVPFLLRPSGDGVHFRLVGDCYVYEFMDGQAVEMWRESDERSTDFHLF